ncbi:MAG: hypothetical protein JWN45_1954 [Acidobacteriaceae bacterium]|nr:hypothetical protein [Acidobacteriaceae bacterium]
MGQQELPPGLRVFTISGIAELITYILHSIIYEPNTLVLESNVWSNTLASGETATAKLAIESGILIISRRRITDSPLEDRTVLIVLLQRSGLFFSVRLK